MYSDYLEKNLNTVFDYQTLEEPHYKETVILLPYLKETLASKHKSKKLRIVIESIEDKLDNLDFFEHLCLTELLTKGKAHRHTFLKHLKENGCKTNVVPFTKQYGPALGNVHFIWKEEGEDDLQNKPTRNYQLYCEKPS